MVSNMKQFEVPRDTGQIAVSAAGTGPLVLCVPGMGESIAAFRYLQPELAAAGYTAAVMDLRGHGESSARFDTYDDEAAASDITAVIEAFGGEPAIIVGNSMGAAAAVLSAADRPELSRALILIGPFVRDHGSAASRVLMRVLLAKPWGPSIWKKYYASLFGDQTMPDHTEHLQRAQALLARPGRWRAFQHTARTSHAVAETALPRVSAPTLAIMGSKDRDFPNPEAEAQFVAAALRGEYEMVPGAGHYPMAEQPDVTLAAILRFFQQAVKND